ncbi:hypothetical protein Rhopal_000006-T1 [Rhodotorula paludigena]|uniref:Ubiquitin-like protease family profile domain-containing protein n=1 Tax=Rhodotorula paludigena TaxID=86838 RepID=A0AAV5GCL6_9BASI|nr:hypothetical protein Rhopal_000006-T1 [Rhodotorula paludigena]
MQEFSRTYGLGETKERARHSSKPPHSTPHVDVGYWTFWHDRVFRKEEDPMYGSTELRKALRSADSLTSATALLHTLGYFMVAAWSLLVRLQPRAAKILLESTLSRAHIDPNCPFWVWSGVALLRNAEVDPHFDSNDARYGWIAETVAGDFSGGEMFLPQLGIVVPVRPGNVLLMRSGLLEHCVLPCTGERCAVVAFRHESTMVHASMGRTAEVLKQSKTWESPPDDSPAYHKLVTELRACRDLARADVDAMAPRSPEDRCTESPMDHSQAAAAQGTPTPFAPQLPTPSTSHASGSTAAAKADDGSAKAASGAAPSTPSKRSESQSKDVTLESLIKTLSGTALSCVTFVGPLDSFDDVVKCAATRLKKILNVDLVGPTMASLFRLYEAATVVLAAAIRYAGNDVKEAFEAHIADDDDLKKTYDKSLAAADDLSNAGRQTALLAPVIGLKNRAGRVVDDRIPDDKVNLTLQRRVVAALYCARGAESKKGSAVTKSLRDGVAPEAGMNHHAGRPFSQEEQKMRWEALMEGARWWKAKAERGVAGGQAVPKSTVAANRLQSMTQALLEWDKRNPKWDYAKELPLKDIMTSNHPHYTATPPIGTTVTAASALAPASRVVSSEAGVDPRLDVVAKLGATPSTSASGTGAARPSGAEVDASPVQGSAREDDVVPMDDDDEGVLPRQAANGKRDANGGAADKAAATAKASAPRVAAAQIQGGTTPASMDIDRGEGKGKGKSEGEAEGEGERGKERSSVDKGKARAQPDMADEGGKARSTTAIDAAGKAAGPSAKDPGNSVGFDQSAARTGASDALSVDDGAAPRAGVDAGAEEAPMDGDRDGADGGNVDEEKGQAGDGAQRGDGLPPHAGPSGQPHPSPQVKRAPKGTPKAAHEPREQHARAVKAKAKPLGSNSDSEDGDDEGSANRRRKSTKRSGRSSRAQLPTAHTSTAKKRVRGGKPRARPVAVTVEGHVFRDLTPKPGTSGNAAPGAGANRNEEVARNCIDKAPGRASPGLVDHVARHFLEARTLERADAGEDDDDDDEAVVDPPSVGQLTDDVVAYLVKLERPPHQPRKLKRLSVRSTVALAASAGYGKVHPVTVSIAVSAALSTAALVSTATKGKTSPWRAYSFDLLEGDTDDESGDDGDRSGSEDGSAASGDSAGERSDEPPARKRRREEKDDDEASNEPDTDPAADAKDKGKGKAVAPASDEDVDMVKPDPDDDHTDFTSWPSDVDITRRTWTPPPFRRKVFHQTPTPRFDQVPNALFVQGGNVQTHVWAAQAATGKVWEGCLDPIRIDGETVNLGPVWSMKGIWQDGPSLERVMERLATRLGEGWLNDEAILVLLNVANPLRSPVMPVPPLPPPSVPNAFVRRPWAPLDAFAYKAAVKRALKDEGYSDESSNAAGDSSTPLEALMRRFPGKSLAIAAAEVYDKKELVAAQAWLSFLRSADLVMIDADRAYHGRSPFKLGVQAIGTDKRNSFTKSELERIEKDDIYKLGRYAMVLGTENGTHWLSVVVDLEKREIVVGDSLGPDQWRLGSESEALALTLLSLPRAFDLRAADPKDPYQDKRPWTFVLLEIPRQTNGNDCGLYATALGRGYQFEPPALDWLLAENPGRYLRSKGIAEIWRGCALDYEEWEASP